ncbi:MAG: hypothetical protein MJ078_05065, partial [Clostridia bacterium]|nr:hypothetical protein [Clostridia bacterium]
LERAEAYEKKGVVKGNADVQYTDASGLSRQKASYENGVSRRSFKTFGKCISSCMVLLFGLTVLLSGSAIHDVAGRFQSAPAKIELPALPVTAEAEESKANESMISENLFSDLDFARV